MVWKECLWALVVITSATAFLPGCTPADKPADSAVVNADDTDLTEADKMIRQLPSPIEMAILVKHSGGSYNASLLNPIQSIDRYATEGKRTMNMGVYSADVGYTSLYKQTQETMFYLNNVRKLSDAIGLSEAFDRSVFERVEEHINDRDSLLHILSGAYDDANAYLKANDRVRASVLMLAGGWVETMYLAAHLGSAGGRPSNEIAARVAQQDAVLRKIIATMAMMPGDETLDSFKLRLEQLAEVLVASELVSGSEEDPQVDMQRMEAAFRIIDDLRGWVVS